jgi:hypothetical protein
MKGFNGHHTRGVTRPMTDRGTLTKRSVNGHLVLLVGGREFSGLVAYGETAARKGPLAGRSSLHLGGSSTDSEAYPLTTSGRTRRSTY